MPEIQLPKASSDLLITPDSIYLADELVFYSPISRSDPARSIMVSLPKVLSSG